jgi:hypothetical protein
MIQVPEGRPSSRPSGRGLSRLHNQRRGCPILARPLRKSLPCFAEAPSEAEGGVEGVGTTLIAQWALPFTAAVSVLRYRHPLQPCHPERNFVIGKANDKVESKDPMFVDATPGNARRSHRAVIARGPAKAVRPPQN